MLAWGGWKNQQRQLGFHKSGRGEKVGSRRRRGLRQPEENFGAKLGSSRLGLEAGEGQEQFTFPIDSPAEAWQG